MVMLLDLGEIGLNDLHSYQLSKHDKIVELSSRSVMTLNGVVAMS